MKNIKRSMMLCEFLMRAPIFAGLLCGLGVILTEGLLFLIISGSPSTYALLSDSIAQSGFELVFIAGIFASMGILAALIARRWFGAKSAITLHLLPVNRAWLLVAWAIGGLVMLLTLVIAQHLSVYLADLIFTAAISSGREPGSYYLEPNRVWLSFLRVDFLHFVLPRSFNEWLELIAVLTCAPLTTVGATLGILSGKRALPIIFAVIFVAGCFLMRAEAIALGFVAAVVSAVFLTQLGYRIVRDGESL